MSGSLHRILRVYVIFFVGALAMARAPWACEIYDDPSGIPHFRAPDESSAIACLGYLHGRDRAWQMDFFRRISQGRRAEVLGKDWIRSDFLMRILGLEEKAKTLVSQLMPREKALLESYSRGVNEGMKEALQKGVYEFSEFHYQPEPWQPENSLSVILLQSFDQTRRSFETQIQERDWESKYGSDSARLFNLEGLPWSTSILKEGEYPKSPTEQLSPTSKGTLFTALNSSDLDHLFTERGTLKENPREGVGSNNWVVASTQSRTKNAWLANDPHLNLNYPPFWHWIHIETTDQKISAIGATVPGVPLILSGTNRHVSWGVTNAFLPVTQLSSVSEKELKGAISRRPLIWVKWGWLKLPFIFKTFRVTQSGHRVLPVPGVPSEGDQALILRWTGFDLQAQEFSGLFDILHARNVADADLIFSKIGVPSLNFVFADDAGSIGYRAVGRTPRFGSVSPFGISHDSLSAVENSFAFSHPLTSDEMPHVLRPSRGSIVSANNAQWPSDSQWKSGRAPYPSFRAFRIEELLAQVKAHDLESLQKVQCDVQAVDARFLLPKMLESLSMDLSGISPDIVETLKNWNYEAQSDCKACGIYRRWIERTLDEQKLNTVSLYRKLSEVRAETSQGVPQVIRSATDQDSLRTALKRNLVLALKDLGYEKTKTLPTWRTLHVAHFFHLAGPDFHPVQPIATPGDDHTVNLGRSSWNGKEFDHTAGASQRLIVEMSQPPQVYSVLAGSNQDLQPRDLSLESQWQRWARCQLQRKEFPLDWTKVGPLKRKDL